MAVYKRGETIDIILACETDAEWDAIYPNEFALAEAKIGNQVYTFDTEVDVETRTMGFSADTSNWEIGDGQADIKIRKNGRNTFLPKGDTYIEFSIVAAISDESDNGN